MRYPNSQEGVHFGRHLGRSRRAKRFLGVIYGGNFQRHRAPFGQIGRFLRCVFDPCQPAGAVEYDSAVGFRIHRHGRNIGGIRQSSEGIFDEILQTVTIRIEKGCRRSGKTLRFGKLRILPLQKSGGCNSQGSLRRAFGSGGAAVTGVEAISNGVPAFRAPAWKNARKTLVIMGSLLGFMFLGLSMLAARTHAMPFDGGVPSVISQVGKLVYGETAAGHALFYALQAGTKVEFMDQDLVLRVVRRHPTAKEVPSIRCGRTRPCRGLRDCAEHD